MRQVLMGRKPMSKEQVIRGSCLDMPLMTPRELMPAPVLYAHKLGQEMTRLRKDRVHTWLRPDSKTQVSIEYIDNRPNPDYSGSCFNNARPRDHDKEIRQLLQAT